MTDETATALSIQGLKKTFHIGFWRKKVEAVRDVSLSCRKGEIYGFMGPNGAGKTTTIKMIMGLIRPDAGTIEIFGRPAGTPKSRRSVGFLPENPYFHEHLKPRELLLFHGHLLGLHGKDLGQEVDTLLDLVQLERDAFKRPLKKLSKGMLQRVGWAQSLLGRPEFILLDEPMSGLDPLGRKLFREILIDLNRQGRTIFFSSHILSDVEMICHSVAIIHKGKITSQGRLDDLLQSNVKRTEVVIRGLKGQETETLRPLAVSMLQQGENHHFIVEGDFSRFMAAAQGHGEIVSFAPLRESLEDLFVRQALPGDAAAPGAA